MFVRLVRDAEPHVVEKMVGRVGRGVETDDRGTDGRSHGIGKFSGTPSSVNYAHRIDEYDFTVRVNAVEVSFDPEVMHERPFLNIVVKDHNVV